MADKEPEIVKAECEQVRQLFERFAPEIARGAVVIKAMAREPGRRTKVALQSVDPAIDPIGACVGKFHSRTLHEGEVRNVEPGTVEIRGRTQATPDGPIKAIVDALNGERIDLVRWYDSLEMLVPLAMGPAKIDQVFLYPQLIRVIVLVKEDQLAWAIGRDGGNVRLASRLIGLEIEIFTQAELHEAINRANKWFRQIPGMTDKAAEVCIKEGCLCYDDLTCFDAGQIANLTGVSQQEAAAMLSFAEEAAQRVEAETYAKADPSRRKPWWKFW